MTYNYIQHADEVLKIEQLALENLRQNIDHSFSMACEQIIQCGGKVIVIGMGKSGHVARKVAATLASTGTPALFMHPSEAAHGDLGMVESKDLAIVISNSGETAEIVLLMEFMIKLKLPIIGITSRASSKIATLCNIHLDIAIKQEACPLGLAPTASTTACMALGDALAIACLKRRGFTREDFIKTHPSGSLGNKQNVRVDTIMHPASTLRAIVNPHCSFPVILKKITESRLGLAIVLDAQQHILGIITDGDIRRAIMQQQNPTELLAKDIMTPRCISILGDTKAQHALDIMSEYKITSLAVINHADILIGILHIHDLITLRSTATTVPAEAISC